ncbi:hypothetical protein AMS68_005260 [Peltaster fructicola]|uniref:Nucleolar pre-ribosomal-associated protein 1 C-terminal domain-containing protein n=1 Tax=Peltaster fructicola TaxID=286661 RepID=A0A6H0XYA9_9PEZI|nr:hypothetical protein AMS68_005260 [Peltaster fructicola]
MSKREHEENQGDRPPKRARPTATVQDDRPAEEIYSARQLQQLLVFQQDDLLRLRHGISSYKAFLESIVYHSNDGAQQERLTLLREYLESEKPREANDVERPFFTQLWQAWSFANSNNSDHLASAVCSLFALLLKTLSTLVDFREHGRLLCRTVLQFQHLRLIKRCLDAPKHKEFLLSPSLRLLIEVLNFDGGTFAHEVYKRREQTFDLIALRKCLTIVKADGTEDDLKRRPAVRTYAVRYTLAHLKLQDDGGKIDILKQRSLCSTLFSYFRSDPPELILEILRTAETQVLKHSDLPRVAKAALLTQQHLDRVLDIATRAEVSDEVSTVAFQWLKSACSTPSYGILRPTGWYPPGTMQLDARSSIDNGAIDLGLESLDFWENEDKYQLKNVVLASWINSLRPNSDLKERDLILICFRHAPELVHAYFRDNALQMDPKLTNTWIGYASFLFEVADLPVPIHAGNIDSSSYAALPPQTSIVLNNILPKPLTQKVLIRCLNQSEKLISFFVVRILNIVLGKISRLQGEYQQAGSQSPRPDLWKEAAKELEATCVAALPSLKDVLLLFRRLPDDDQHVLQREATSRLINVYMTALPTPHEGTVDISGALMTTLARNNNKNDGEDELAWDELELEHLIAIAQNSTDMRWFNKAGTLSTSPMVAILQLALKQDSQRLKDLAGRVLHAHGIIIKGQTGALCSSMDALLSSLESNQNEHVWDFLEQSCLRAVKTPVKYLDDIDGLGIGSTASDQTSLLPVVLWEQASFIVAKPAEERAALMRWVNSAFNCWLLSAESNDTLTRIMAQVKAIDGWNAKPGSKVKPKPIQIASQDTNNAENTITKPHEHRLSLFSAPAVETPDHPELFRWQKKDIDTAFEDHDVDSLILCLCSEYNEVRRQARTQLTNLMVKLQASEMDDKEQLYLVIGELLETYSQTYGKDETPLPYLVGTFAVHAVNVQVDPTHHMYPKLNRYLMKAPEWRVSRISSYWLAACSMSMPSEDDGYWKETQWVLDWLVDGLRTKADLEILRSAGSFERLMTLYASPSASEKLVRHRVLEIVYRAALIDPLTLVTRAGVLSWLQMLKGDLAASLRHFVLDKSDFERLETWTGMKSGTAVTA